jgi:hypothetical protein
MSRLWISELDDILQSSLQIARVTCAGKKIRVGLFIYLWGALTASEKRFLACHSFYCDFPNIYSMAFHSGEL